jgi:hypothetical protein
LANETKQVCYQQCNRVGTIHILVHAGQDKTQTDRSVIQFSFIRRIMARQLTVQEKELRVYDVAQTTEMMLNIYKQMIIPAAASGGDQSCDTEVMRDFLDVVLHAWQKFTTQELKRALIQVMGIGCATMKNNRPTLCIVSSQSDDASARGKRVFCAVYRLTLVQLKEDLRKPSFGMDPQEDVTDHATWIRYWDQHIANTIFINKPFNEPIEEAREDVVATAQARVEARAAASKTPLSSDEAFKIAWSQLRVGYAYLCQSMKLMDVDTLPHATGAPKQISPAYVQRVPAILQLHRHCHLHEDHGKLMAACTALLRDCSLELRALLGRLNDKDKSVRFYPSLAMDVRTHERELYFTFILYPQDAKDHLIDSPSAAPAEPAAESSNYGPPGGADLSNSEARQ